MERVDVGFIVLFFFFFNDTATTEIYTLSLHDALPICQDALELDHSRVHEQQRGVVPCLQRSGWHARVPTRLEEADRKSTRLNSSHANISYAVFCLKKKKTI